MSTPRDKSKVKHPSTRPLHIAVRLLQLAGKWGCYPAAHQDMEFVSSPAVGRTGAGRNREAPAWGHTHTWGGAYQQLMKSQNSGENSSGVRWGVAALDRVEQREVVHGRLVGVLPVPHSSRLSPKAQMSLLNPYGRPTMRSGCHTSQAQYHTGAALTLHVMALSGSTSRSSPSTVLFL